MRKIFSPLMAGIYTALSAVLLFWHAAWQKIFGTGQLLGTTWSWILAVVFLVITIRIALFPVFVKQIKSQRAMQVLQPRVKALQEKHKGDRETMQKELMELYRTEKANPLMGCLPMFVQIPVFFGLFHVLRHLQPGQPDTQKTLYGWTVGQFDSASRARLFGAPISAGFKSSAAQLSELGASVTNVKIVAAILVLVMMATTYLTSRQMILKTGWAEDPQQKMIQRLMLYGVPASLLISGFLYPFPLGVSLYWVTTNLFSLGQQQWVLRKYPPPVTAKNSSATKSTPSKTVPPKTDAGTARPKLGVGKEPTSGAPVLDARTLAPKVGAKPVKARKRGAAKER